ncbi:MAG: RNA methyltransferase [Clostridia bacterium]|nr:RNA methyltransferase [Clostridia bacterium]
MIRIESIHNPQIQSLRKLSKAKARRESGTFLVEGPRMVEEALALHLPRMLLVSRTGLFADLVHAAEADGLQVIEVSGSVMDALSESKTPQGVMALCPMKEETRGPAGPLILALDGVQNPGNVGTMIRTAEAAGITCVLLGVGCADLYSAKTLAATMGSVFRLDILQVPDLKETLRMLSKDGYNILSGVLDGMDFYEACPPGKSVLVIGNEGNGISEEIKDVSTHCLTLPMWGRAESLNASVAAGIMIYELARRNHLAEGSN